MGRGGSAGHSQSGKGIGRSGPQSPPPAPIVRRNVKASHNKE